MKSGLICNPDSSPKRVVISGSGPLLLAVAAGLQNAGARVEPILEQAPLTRLAGFGVTLLGSPGKLAEGARYRLATRNSAYRTGSWVVRAEGRGRVEQVTATDGRKQWKIPCDWLATGFHLVPNLELPRLRGWDCACLARTGCRSSPPRHRMRQPFGRRVKRKISACI